MVRKFDLWVKNLFGLFGLLICSQEKVQYYDIATEKRAEFDTAMSEYLKRKVCLLRV